MQVETIMKVKPFCDSLTVIESQVGESQLDSGVIVPFDFDGKDIKRGVVVDTGECRCEAWSTLEPGTVIYYRQSLKIGDVHVVHHDSIVAYEEAN